MSPTLKRAACFAFYIVLALLSVAAALLISACATPADIKPGATVATPQACLEQRARDPKHAGC